MQWPQIGAGGEQRVGPAGLFHREVRRDRGDAFELRAEPSDAIEVHLGQSLGRDGAVADPTRQTANRREADILRVIREGYGPCLGCTVTWQRDRHHEPRQARVEACRRC